MKLLTWTLLAALPFQALLAHADVLPGMKSFHVVWVGSPLRDDQFSKLKLLCTKIRENNLKGGEIQELNLWFDPGLYKSGESLFGEKRKSLDPECAQLLRERNVRDLFEPQACNAPLAVAADSGKLGQKLETGLASPINCQSADGSPCPKNVQPELTSACVELEKNRAQLQRAYQSLLEKKPQLGGAIFAPLADIIRVLAVEKSGGIYMDINKDFTDFGFSFYNPHDAQRASQCDTIVAAQELPYFQAPDLTLIPNDGAPNVSQQYFNAKFYKTLVKSQRTHSPTRDYNTFTNNDYFAAACPGSKPVRKLLGRIATGYSSLLENPLLGQFMDSSLFSTLPWVWSVGGPISLTEVLAEEKPSVLRAYNRSTYQGATSWLKVPPRPWAPILMNACLKQAAEAFPNSQAALKAISDECFEKNTFSSGNSSRLSQDLDTCFFDSLLEAVGEGRIDKSALSHLNHLGTQMPTKVAEMEQKMKDACRAAGSRQSKAQAETLPAAVGIYGDFTKTAFHCVMGEAGLIAFLDQRFKEGPKPAPAPGVVPPAPPVEPVQFKKPVMLTLAIDQIDFKGLCNPSSGGK